MRDGGPAAGGIDRQSDVFHAGPVREAHGREGWQPFKSRGGQMRRGQARSHAEEMGVTVEIHVHIERRGPQLRKRRIQIDVGSAGHMRDAIMQLELAGKIDDCIRVGRPAGEVGGTGRVVIDKKGRAIFKAELRRDFLPIALVHAGSGGVTQIECECRAIKMFHQPDIAAGLAQADRPVEKSPGVAGSVARHVGDDHAADDFRFARRGRCHATPSWRMKSDFAKRRCARTLVPAAPPSPARHSSRKVIATVRVAFGGPVQASRAWLVAAVSSVGSIPGCISAITTRPMPLVVTRTPPEPWSRNRRA